MGVPLRGVGVPSVGTGMTSTGGPERQNTEQCGHSNSALSCGPRKAVEESRVYSAHMFCFKPGGRGHTSTCREKAEDRYIHACTCICTWRSEKHKLNCRGPYPGGFYGPSEVKSRQVLELATCTYFPASSQPLFDFKMCNLFQDCEADIFTQAHTSLSPIPK